MLKKLIIILWFFYLSTFYVFGQVYDEIRQELINIYTQYAQSRTGNERLQYIRNSESFREIFQSRYGDRDISYTPIRFGVAGRPLTSSNLELYSLEEFVSANRGGRAVEIIQYRIFVRIDNTYKLDWEASVGYNPVTFARFRALQDGQIATMRCFANLDTSRYDEYFGIGIRDELTNFQFTAYIRRDSENGLLLMDYLERGDARPAILEMYYNDRINRYSKEVLITNFIMQGWVR